MPTLPNKKVGFSSNSNIQGDSLIVNNGLTASIRFNFGGSSGLTFSLPTADGSSGQGIITDGAGNLSFGNVAGGGTNGTSGTSGQAGTSGTSGVNGTSGSSGQNGTSGSSGTSTSSGTSGSSETSGQTGTSGTSGISGSSGANGTSGISGTSGSSGVSITGANGTSGTSGQTGTSGSSGQTGTSGTSGTVNASGTTNYVSKFTAATTLGNSVIVDNGTTVTISNQVQFADGTSTSPSMAFISATQTGFYRVSGNRIGFLSGGNLTFTSPSNETDNFQVRGYATASNGTYYYYSLATSGGSGVWKLGLESLDAFVLDRWSGAAYVTTGLRLAMLNGVPQIRIANGSAATPSFTFQDDTNTGLYRITENQIGVSTGGVLALTVGSTISVANRTYFEKAVNHYPVVNASVSGLYTVDMSASNVFNLTLTGNTTLDYTNSTEGSYVLLIKQDGSGGRTFGLTGGGKFIGATAISIATASNAKSLVQLIHIGTQSVVVSQTNLSNL